MGKHKKDKQSSKEAEENVVYYTLVEEPLSQFSERYPKKEVTLGHSITSSPATQGSPLPGSSIILPAHERSRISVSSKHSSSHHHAEHKKSKGDLKKSHHDHKKKTKSSLPSSSHSHSSRSHSFTQSSHKHKRKKSHHDHPPDTKHPESSAHSSSSVIRGGSRRKSNSSEVHGITGQDDERERSRPKIMIIIILLALLLLLGAITAILLLAGKSRGGISTTLPPGPTPTGGPGPGGSTPFPFCPNQVLPKDLNDSLAVGDFCYNCVRSNPNVTSSLPSRECRVECCDVFYPNDIGKFTDCYFRCTQ